MEIRQATHQDAPLLSAMCAEVQALHAEHLPDKFRHPKTDYFAEEFFQMMLGKPYTHIFIVEEDHVPMGYILTEITRREENPFSHRRNYLHIDQIGVRAEHRGKGCGRALMAHARQLAKAEGLTDITLNTWYFNNAAQGFFRALGFETMTLQMWLHMPDQAGR